MRRIAVVLGILLVLITLPFEAAAKRPFKILEVNEIVPGTKAVGFSVFRGAEPESFDVLLGEPSDKAVPGLVIILARIYGTPTSINTPLEITGPIAGMSGSPIFINCSKYEQCLESGTLVGALSYSFMDFPQGGMNTGVTPAAHMFGARSRGYAGRGGAAPISRLPLGVKHALLVYGPAEIAEETFAKNATFTASLMGGELASWCAATPRSTLKPGSTILIEFARGGVSVGGWGTVTWVDGDDIWAFGHGIDEAGAVQIPFTHAAIAETFQTPYGPRKLAGCKLDAEGVITSDTSREITGTIQKRAALVPLTISLRAGENEFFLEEEIAPGTEFTNMLAAAVASYWTTLKLGTSSERTFAYQARILLKGQPEIFLGPNVAVLPPGSAKRLPLGVLFRQIYAILNMLEDSGFPYTVEEIRISAEVLSERRQIYTLEQATLSKYTARPGETVDLTVVVREFPDEKFKSLVIPIIVPTDFFERLEKNPIFEGGLSTEQTVELFASGAFSTNITIRVQGGSSFDDRRPPPSGSPRDLHELVQRIQSRIEVGRDQLYVQYVLPPSSPQAVEGRTAQRADVSETEKRSDGGWRETDPAALSAERLPPQPAFETVISPPISGYVLFGSTSLTLRVEAPPPPENNDAPPPAKKKSFWRRILPF